MTRLWQQYFRLWINCWHKLRITSTSNYTRLYNKHYLIFYSRVGSVSGSHYGRGPSWKDSPTSSPAINSASPVASALTPAAGNKSPAGRMVSTILPSVSGDSATSEHTTSAASAAAQYLNNTDNLILSSHGDTRLQDRNGPIASPMSSSDSNGGADTRLTTSTFKRLNGHGSSSSRRGAGVDDRDSHRSSSTKTKSLTKAGRNAGGKRPYGQLGRRRRRRSRSPGGRSDDNSASNSDTSRSGSPSGSSNSSSAASSRSSSSSGASRSRSSSPLISGRRNRQHKPTSSLVGTGAARSVPFEERTNCAICVRNLPARPSGKTS